MAITDAGALDWVTTDEIAPALRRMTDEDDITIIAWTWTPLIGGAGRGLGVWLVSGDALAGSMVQPWSIVLKGWKPPPRGSDPAAFDAPYREMELYRSGMLNDLTDGVRAPRCFGDMKGPDGSVWVWLEDLTATPQAPWVAHQYSAVARHLGRFSGSWLTGGPLPEHPCLSRTWLRQWVEATGPPREAIGRVADHPVVQRSYTPQVVEAYARLWDNREAHYAVIDALPRTFAHLDAFPRNMFFRPRPNGGEDVVLIDWSFAGIAGVGEELVPLVTASAIFMDLPIAEARELLGEVVEQYIDGLRDTGWDGDPKLVRTGYERAVVLRYGLGGIRPFLHFFAGDVPRKEVEQMAGRPFDEVVENLVAFNEWMCDLARDM